MTCHEMPAATHLILEMRSMASYTEKVYLRCQIRFIESEQGGPAGFGGGYV